MKRFFLAMTFLFLVSDVQGQVLHTFTYAHLYDNGTLHLVIDPNDSGTSQVTLQAALIVRRTGTLPWWDRSIAKEMPEWWSFEAAEETPDAEYAAGERRPIRYKLVGSSDARQDSQVFNFNVGDADKFAPTFEIGYRFLVASTKGPWFYATATRITDPVPDPSVGATFTLCFCDASLTQYGSCPTIVQATGLIGTTCFRMEIWDSSSSDWVQVPNAVGGYWTPWQDTTVTGIFNLPCPLFTTTETRFFWQTLDGSIYGPVAGSNIDVAECPDVTVDENVPVIELAVNNFSVSSLTAGAGDEVIVGTVAGFSKPADPLLTGWAIADSEPDTSGFDFVGVYSDTLNQGITLPAVWATPDGDSTISLAWRPGSPAPTSGYELEVSTNNGPFYSLGDTLTFGVSDTTYTHVAASTVAVRRAKLVYKVTAVSGPYRSAPLVSDPVYNDCMEMMFRLWVYDGSSWAFSQLESGIGVSYPLSLGGGRHYLPSEP